MLVHLPFLLYRKLRTLIVFVHGSVYNENMTADTNIFGREMYE